MPAVIAELFSSKKFIFVVLATVLLMVAAKFDLMTKEDVGKFLGLLWPTYLASQGLADWGKHAAAAKAKTENVKAPAAMTSMTTSATAASAAAATAVAKKTEETVEKTAEEPTAPDV